MAYIYYIQNKNNDKVYIGSTVRDKVEYRFNEHRYRLRDGSHGNKHLQSSWNLNGEEDFEFGILEECENSTVYRLEEYYIEILGTFDKTRGYNKSKVAKHPMAGTKMSEVHKRKISNTLKGRPSPMKGKKNPKAKDCLKLAMKARRKKVVNTDTGEVFESVIDFCKFYNINRTSFHKKVGKSSHKGINFDYYIGGKRGSNL